MFKPRLLTPGPVPVPERVRRAMAAPVVHHRTAEFRALFGEVRAKLKQVFQTDQDVLLLASTGTGAMEACVTNLLSPGDRVIVVRGGKFGERWAELCATYGVEAVCVDVEWGCAVRPEQVRQAFEVNPTARALLVQASETSTGVWHPVRELAGIVHEQADRLIIVDAISALAVQDLPMDAWDLDAVVSASQKAWLLPPGLAFVALSRRARAALERGQARYYFDLRKELAGQARGHTAYTPAVSLIQGLREALAMILEPGLERTFARHEGRAKLVRTAVRALGLELLAADSPSFACTAVRLPEGVDARVLADRLRDVYGLQIAGGQGPLAGRVLRIGHMGDVDGFDMISAIAALEMALLDLGGPVKLGEGTRAAMQLLRELAEED